MNKAAGIRVREAVPADASDWIRMRTALWPEEPSDHPIEVSRFFRNRPAGLATFVAEQADQGLCGFLEAGTRPHAEGCRSSPVGYIEGWWVDAPVRRQGIGRQLVAAAEAWARNQGLSEIASDADIGNDSSQAAHRALGYAEAQRIVCFRKAL